MLFSNFCKCLSEEHRQPSPHTKKPTPLTFTTRPKYYYYHLVMQRGDTIRCYPCPGKITISFKLLSSRYLNCIKIILLLVMTILSVFVPLSLFLLLKRICIKITQQLLTGILSYCH